MEIVIVWLLLAIAFGAIPAFIAESKGRNFIAWWLYGSAIFIVAIFHAILLKTDDKIAEADALANGGRKCPHCAEVVKMEAKVCRFCQRDLPPIDLTQSVTQSTKSAVPSTELLQQRLATRLLGVLVALFVIGGVAYYSYTSRSNAVAAVEASETDGGQPKDSHPNYMPKGAPAYLPLDNMVVNLADAGGEKVAQIGITLELVDAGAVERIKPFLPTIRARVLLQISTRQAAELLTDEGKQTLAKDILREASLPFGGSDLSDGVRPPRNPVVGVLFTSFIVQ